VVLDSGRYAGNAAVTEVFHALSVTFPAGESFFMDSVRHFEETLRNTHPLLWKDVVLFFKQESLHSAQHEKWNRRIEAEFGHPMMKLERCIDDVMQFQKRFLSPLNQLACTAAFEHFTATFGQILLESTDGLRQMGAPQRRLWMWHALEEIEHKAVAFDVYQAVSGGGVGGYLRRCLAMMWVTVFFALTLGFVRIYLHWLPSHAPLLLLPLSRLLVLAVWCACTCMHTLAYSISHSPGCS